MNEYTGRRFIFSLFPAQEFVCGDSFAGENEHNWIMVDSTSVYLLGVDGTGFKKGQISFRLGFL